MSFDDFVIQQLDATYARIDSAVALLTDGHTQESEAVWLRECRERDATADLLATAIDWPLYRFGLTATEHRCLWVLIAQELDPRSRLRLRDLATEDDVDVSTDVLRRVVYGSRPTREVWRELSPAGRLRSSCLIAAAASEDTPSHRTNLRLCPRLLALVHGDIAVDDELRDVVVPDQPTPPSLEALVVSANVRETIRAALAGGVQLAIATGLTGSGRRSLLTAAAAQLGAQVLTIDARKISKDKKRADRQFREIARECIILSRVPLLVNADALAAATEGEDRLDLIEDRLPGPVLATSSRPLARRWRTAPVTVELEALSGAERSDLWCRALPEATPADAELLATMYPLAPALIDAVGRAAITSANGVALDAKHVSAGIRSVLDDRLAGLASRLTVTQAWDDLVLPEEQTLAVVELLARIRTRRRVYEEWGFAEKLGKGLGVTALFSGPPGTGKSMCAGLIAKDLGTELYQVEMPKIVSKWVGETEKNLAALFDAAEAGHAVLLFDEADSLFGKRTAVTSSNDRYANQETNYLLQRLETFAGICILTTNHEPAIDEAFRRRLAVHIRFPLPDEEERERLWKAMLPTRAPVDEQLDLEALAKKFVMGGGNIRNAVVRAAFLAADANERIGSYHLRQAAQLEYEAMGKLGAR